MKPSNWILIASLYVTQFLPVSFFFMGLPAILRAQGKTLEEIGALYLLGFVWVFKILWAPMIDRISFGRLGHYRGWLIVMQTAMVGMLLLISQIDGLGNFPLLVMLGLVLTVFSATQDIATDAITCRLLPAESRGIGNSIQVAGGLIGIMLGGGATLSLYPQIGWTGCFLLMAAVLCACLVQILFFKEPPVSAGVVQQRVPYSRIWKIWREPGMGTWALLMMIVPLGVGMIFAMLSPMLVDIGWSLEAVGFTLNIVGSLVGLAAVSVTGVLIKKIGRRPILIATAFIQAAIILSVLPLASGATAMSVILPGVVLVFLIYNPVATVMLTIMMDRTAHGSEGTDFTVQYSLYSFMGFLSGTIALQVAGAAGYPVIVAIAAVLAIVAGLLSIRLYRAEPRVASRHDVDAGSYPAAAQARG
ncbi:MFS family permease [Neorhizobium huautlense]|uniref:MFS family permease n=1 Tax=Neorhizobium huautlense TaxID=67774 RepID=A0ABT9PNA2_9HYPH|nr:MFS transporter [Neorhizobium huautlense]MDP9835700.1 MFS family permease [Neorhizobium huautlense]